VVVSGEALLGFSVSSEALVLLSEVPDDQGLIPGSGNEDCILGISVLSVTSHNAGDNAVVSM